MKYTKLKILAWIQYAIAFAFGGAVLLFGLYTLYIHGFHSEKNGYIPSIIALFGLAIVVMSAFEFRKRMGNINAFETMTFDNYRKGRPDLVRGGHVKCFHCEGTQVRVRPLRNHTYHREHFCGQCGTVLYFSPE